MSDKTAMVTKQLRELGVSPATVMQVQTQLEHREAPAIKGAVTRKMRDVIAQDGRAVLVLCTNGRYKVFSFEGHETLRESAKKHRPWEISRRKELKH